MPLICSVLSACFALIAGTGKTSEILAEAPSNGHDDVVGHGGIMRSVHARHIISESKQGGKQASSPSRLTRTVVAASGVISNEGLGGGQNHGNSNTAAEKLVSTRRRQRSQRRRSQRQRQRQRRSQRQRQRQGCPLATYCKCDRCYQNKIKSNPHFQAMCAENTIQPHLCAWCAGHLEHDIYTCLGNEWRHGEKNRQMKACITMSLAESSSCPNQRSSLVEGTPLNASANSTLMRSKASTMALDDTHASVVTLGRLLSTLFTPFLSSSGP